MTMHRSARPFVLVLASASLLLAGCGRAGASTDQPEAASPSARAEPSLTASPSIEPSLESSPSAALVTDPPMPQPPAASIAVEGGDPVVGELGSFTWENSGSDSPWLPGNPIHVGSGERLTLTLAGPAVGLVNWTVGRAPSGANGSGVVGMAEGTHEPVSFAAPPSGSWSVSVDVWFADNLGSAAYYWLMEVD